MQKFLSTPFEAARRVNKPLMDFLSGLKRRIESPLVIRGALLNSPFAGCVKSRMARFNPEDASRRRLKNAFYLTPCGPGYHKAAKTRRCMASLNRACYVSR